jgi:outer membrane immunogenic protein
MYFKGLAIAAGIAVAITGQAATAADLPARAYPAPVAVAPVYNWTGFYVGGGFGYGLYDVETSTFAPGFDNAFNNGDTGGRGWLGRVQVGYDYQFASWVVGVFADYDWSNIRGTVADHNSSNNFDLKQSSAWAVGGRIGYVVVPQLLAFTTIGYTEARFQITHSRDGSSVAAQNMPSPGLDRVGLGKPNTACLSSPVTRLR